MSYFTQNLRQAVMRFWIIPRDSPGKFDDDGDEMNFLRPLKKYFQRFVLLISCASFFCMLDGHVLVLQTVAWAKMAYTFAQRESVPKAVSETFDGEHPCEMCKKIFKINRGHTQMKDMATNGQIRIYDVVQKTFAIENVAFETCHFAAQNIFPRTIKSPPPTPPPKNNPKIVEYEKV